MRQVGRKAGEVGKKPELETTSTKRQVSKQLPAKGQEMRARHNPGTAPCVGLAGERESPENPGALEKRVALVPGDVKKLVAYGCKVFVEEGAGSGVGFSDKDYERSGAVIQPHKDLYGDKDLLIKLKGPAMEDIPLMRRGSTLFCMAHFHSFPARARLLEEHEINVLAMENIVEYPVKIDDDTRLSRMASDHALEPFVNKNMLPYLNIGILGYDEAQREAIRRFSNHNPLTLTLFNEDVHVDRFENFGRQSLYVYHSKKNNIPDDTLDFLRAKECYLYDLNEFESNHRKLAVDCYATINPPASFGLRRIQCLHETGMAGARYGFKLLQEVSPLKLAPEKCTAVVLGYGNVGMGAIHECYRQGVKTIYILGLTHTRKDRIEEWLSKAHLVVNGAEQPVELRGKNFLVSNRHVREVMKQGSVLIDLIGGSAANRSPVEPVVECTYLTDPYFVRDRVFISALWGWPMMGMMRETAVRYSGQIIDVLLNEEKLIEGIADLPPGVKPALVCGPFQV